MWGAVRYVQIPRYRALILRETYPELQEMMDNAEQFKKLGAEWNEQKKRWRFPSGSFIEFGYFERWDHHQRYQGQEYQYICWDELGTCPEERRWTFLMSRCRSALDGVPPQMRATANPGGRGHAWLKKRFIDKCGEDGQRVYVDPKTGLKRRFIPAKLTDNPTLIENDPMYKARLESLPDVMRDQLLYGDWSAASGMALSELNREDHLIEPFDVPEYWNTFLAMDWGYAHPAAIGFFRASPEGQVFLQDSLHLWRKTPLEQAERIHQKLEELGYGGEPLKHNYFVAGRDAWADIKARGEDVPTVAEQFSKNGLHLRQANSSRVAGLNNIRRYISVRGPGGTKKDPKFVLFDTPGNRKTFECLETMVTDPNDPEDALKTDADEYGEGGDDPYDMVRYGLASRPLHPKLKKKKPKKDRNFDEQFDEIIKRHPANKKYKRRRFWM